MIFFQDRPLQCQLASGGPDAACKDLCLYDFPGCAGCPHASHAERSCSSSQDPMASAVVRGWIDGISGISK